MATKIPLLIGDGLRRNAYKLPVKIAAKDHSRQITYSELNMRVNQLAHGLLSVGVRKGDSVAVMVGNRIEHLEILFATAKIGALAIPLDIKWKALELGAVVSFFKPSVLILQQECVAELERARSIQDLSFLKPTIVADLRYGGLLDGQSTAEPGVQVDEDDPFAVLLTSGTTGFPKGCLTTHRTFVFHCINNAIEKGLGVHDRALLASPIYFNAGRSFTLGIIYYGGTVFLQERLMRRRLSRPSSARRSPIWVRCRRCANGCCRFPGLRTTIRARSVASPSRAARSTSRSCKLSGSVSHRISIALMLRQILARWPYPNPRTWTNIL